MRVSKGQLSERDIGDGGSYAQELLFCLYGDSDSHFGHMCMYFT